MFERAVRDSRLDWTILRPGGFHSNAYAWAETIRARRTVEAPFGDVGLPGVDPGDVADRLARARPRRPRPRADRPRAGHTARTRRGDRRRAGQPGAVRRADPRGGARADAGVHARAGGRGHAGHPRRALRR